MVTKNETASWLDQKAHQELKPESAKIIMSTETNTQKILLIDAFSTLHVGNGALLDNTYKLCQEHISGEIEIISIDPETNIKKFPSVTEDIFSNYKEGKGQKLYEALKITLFCVIEILNTVIFKSRIRFPWRGKYRETINAIDRADICISMSGETINDHYMPHMYLRLLTYKLAITRGKKFIIFPQSIGPVYRKLSYWLLRTLLDGAHTIIARDHESLKLAEKIWGKQKTNLLLSPDVAVTQNSIKSPDYIDSTEKKLIGLTVSEIPKNEIAFQGTYLNELLDTICLSLDTTNYKFVVMPSNYAKNKISADYALCESALKTLIKKGYQAEILKNEIIHPDTYQGIQKALFAFISTRMHVGILATSAGIPTLMINTQHKIKSYMKLIGMDDFAVDLNNISNVRDPLDRIITNNAQIREQLIRSNESNRSSVTAALNHLSEQLHTEA